MAQTVADILSRNPSAIEKNRPVAETVMLLRDADAGAVIVLDSESVARLSPTP